EIRGTATLWLLRIREARAHWRGAIAGAPHRRGVQVCRRSGFRKSDRGSANRCRSNPWSGSRCWSAHPFLQLGQRVRIGDGALDGVEGILLSQDQDEDHTLVVSIDAIQRSIAVRIREYEVEPV